MWMLDIRYRAGLLGCSDQRDGVHMYSERAGKIILKNGGGHWYLFQSYKLDLPHPRHCEIANK